MKESLRSRESRLLRDIVSRRNPKLLPLVDVTAARRLTQDEREELRDLVGGELAAFGYLGTPDSDKYGSELDALIAALGRISEWP